MNGFAKVSIRIGEYLLFALKLQFFWFVATFRYGVVTGIFPATVASLECLFDVLKNSEEIRYLKGKKVMEKAKFYFKQANLVGFASSFVLLFLVFDLRVSSVRIHNMWLHVCLIALLALFLSVCLYLFPVVSFMEKMSVKDTFRQAFFLVLCSIPQTLAMLVSFALALYFSVFFPLLAFFPIPVFFLPVGHFSYQAMKRLDEANKKEREKEE